MNYETVIWELSDGVGRITLNRPDSLNAWTEEFGQGLKQVVTVDAADPAVRAVLVTGAGRGFSSGADLKAGFDPHPDDGMPSVRGSFTASTTRSSPGCGCSRSRWSRRSTGRRWGSAPRWPSRAIWCLPQSQPSQPGVREHRADARRWLHPVVPAAVGKARCVSEWRCWANGCRRNRRSTGVSSTRVYPDGEAARRARRWWSAWPRDPRAPAGSSRRSGHAAHRSGGWLDLEADLRHELARTRDFGGRGRVRGEARARVPGA